ncbi:MAG: hypothetical protein UV34_C0047G0004 [Parcubacteria group bacterium GW2011_GWB1_42_6]|nr:MAG: hypothetical protein UV34_C0047G0004 [Parcubacteria group bacterium GW2011_GWB1_42_6]
MERGDRRGGLETISSFFTCPHDPFQSGFIDARRTKASDGSESDDLQLDPDDFFRWKRHFLELSFLERKTIIAGHY